MQHMPHKKLPITKKRLSTGVKGLDRLLGGGVEVGAVTEIVGEYGTGKTQLCHQLAVMAKLEGVGRVLYLDADGTFRPERIVSIAEARGLGPEEALENIYVVRVDEWPQLLFLREKIDKYALVVLDSLPTIFIAPRNIREARKFKGRIALLANELLKRAIEKSIAVILVNIEYRGNVFAEHYLSPFVNKVIKLIKEREELSAKVIPLGDRTKLTITEEGVREIAEN